MGSALVQKSTVLPLMEVMQELGDKGLLCMCLSNSSKKILLLHLSKAAFLNFF